MARSWAALVAITALLAAAAPVRAPRARARARQLGRHEAGHGPISGQLGLLAARPARAGAPAAAQRGWHGCCAPRRLRGKPLGAARRAFGGAARSVCPPSGAPTLGRCAARLLAAPLRIAFAQTAARTFLLRHKRLVQENMARVR
jgi:hypothetical protein